MGGHPWFYEVEYEPDINSALQKLREREFKAGRYYPAMEFPSFPVNLNLPTPGAQHRSIDEALTASEATGTMSILDMLWVADEPDFCTLSPLPKDQLIDLFGTDKPIKQMVDDSVELFELLERGQGVYIVYYEDDVPIGLFFAGYSFD